MDEAKRERVQEWLTKAYIDLDVAAAIALGPRYRRAVAVYHCQQAAEKAIKGYLFFRDTRFDRTHDVEALVNAAIPLEPRFVKYKLAAKRLTPYSAVYRYPGSPPMPTKREVEQAVRLADRLYTFVVSILPNEVHPKLERGK